VYEPDAMSIDTAAVIEGFLRILRANGGVLAAGAGAIELHCDPTDTQSSTRWTIVTPAATWRARHVVNAAGAWVDLIARRAGVDPLGVVPMRRTAAIAPAPDHVTAWPLVMDVAGRYYCEPEPGGLLISPADETPLDPCDAQPDELDVALALERVREATGLPLRSVRRAWAGLRTFAPDRVPVLGEDPTAPGFWWLAGQGGAGIKTAPAMAQLLARLIGGNDLPDTAHAVGLSAAALSPARFR
jgi:D-arginine dehydrogenase